MSGRKRLKAKDYRGKQFSVFVPIAGRMERVVGRVKRQAPVWQAIKMGWIDRSSRSNGTYLELEVDGLDKPVYQHLSRVKAVPEEESTE